MTPVVVRRSTTTEANGSRQVTSDVRSHGGASRPTSPSATAADALRELGRDVLPRDRTSLVTWREPFASVVVERLTTTGVIVRSIPHDLVRASFGAWNDEHDLRRLLTALPR